MNIYNYGKEIGPKFYNMWCKEKDQIFIKILKLFYR